MCKAGCNFPGDTGGGSICNKQNKKMSMLQCMSFPA
jgi:hypothetical protein